MGAACLQRYRSAPTRDTTLLHEALACTAAQHAQPHELPSLVRELRRLLDNERRAREALAAAGVRVPPEAPSTAPLLNDRGGGAAADGAKGSYQHGWSDGADDTAYFFRWRCRVCRHLCYFSVVQCGCATESYLCPEHGLHTHGADDANAPASYIHLDEDPEVRWIPSDCFASLLISSDYLLDEDQETRISQIRIFPHMCPPPSPASPPPIPLELALISRLPSSSH